MQENNKISHEKCIFRIIITIKEQQVMLFDAGGKMIFSKHLSAEENVTLPTGVYVVRGEYEQVKAIKK